MSGKRWNHNYTSKATGAIISNFVSVVPALCSHPNSTGRIYCMWVGEEFHLFSAEAGEPNEDLYLKWQESNETWQTCKSCHLNMSKQNLAVSEVGQALGDKPHTLPRRAGQLGRSKGEPRGASLHGLGLTWWGLAWSAGGLFIDTSTCLSCIGFIMEKFYGDMLYWLENDSLVFKVTEFITQKHWFWSESFKWSLIPT